MTIFVTVLHCLVCFILIVLVLLQKGKGAEIGAVFGGSSSTTIFGSAGAGNFLTRITTWSAVVFMVTSFYLAYVALNTDEASTFSAPPASADAQSAAPAAAKTPAADFVEVMDEAPPTGAAANAGAAARAPSGDAANTTAAAAASTPAAAPAEHPAAAAEHAPVSPVPGHSPQ